MYVNALPGPGPHEYMANYLQRWSVTDRDNRSHERKVCPQSELWLCTQAFVPFTRGKAHFFVC